MDDKQKRKKIREYFTKKDAGFSWPVLLIFGGAFAFMVGASNYVDELQCVGGGMVLFGLLLGGVALGRRASMPSDPRIDQWFEEDLKKISTHALKKMDLSPDLLTEKEPLMIIGPIFWDWNDYGVPENDMWLKLGKDNVLRYTIISVLYIFTAEHLMAAYECIFNFLKNEKVHEDTYEFHYQDIVAVTTHENTHSRILPRQKKKQTLKEQEFHITVPGESITIIIDSDTLTENTKGDVYRKDEVDRTVQRLRALIRDKKQSLTSQAVPTTPPAYAPPPASMPEVPAPENSSPTAPPPTGNVDAGTGAGSQGVNFCSNCGRQVQPEERFCSNCGHQLIS